MFDHEWLQLKNQELQTRFRAQKDSFVLEKTYVVYIMQRKTMEDANIDIENIDDYIAEARALKTTFFENILVGPTASSSSQTCYESSELEEEDEEDVEHADEESYEQPSAPENVSPGNAPTFEASQPSTYANKADQFIL